MWTYRKCPIAEDCWVCYPSQFMKPSNLNCLNEKFGHLIWLCSWYSENLNRVYFKWCEYLTSIKLRNTIIRVFEKLESGQHFNKKFTFLKANFIMNPFKPLVLTKSSASSSVSFVSSCFACDCSFYIRESFIMRLRNRTF